MPQPEPSNVAPPSPLEPKLERAQRKKLANRLGWKLVGHDTVEVKIERSFHIGPRTIIVRGRVAIPIPAEFLPELAEVALLPLVTPATEKFRYSVERAVNRILRAPDDVAKQHIFEAPSFFTALEVAQRGLVREYQDLENKRVDDDVERDLGLSFYLESFTHAQRELQYFVGPTNSGKTHAALELLRRAQTGTYLAPLRLLALEIHERLNELGVPSSLITGEEHIINPAAKHVSSTVEMVDLHREVDIAIIDEAQMLQDEQRGWAWTLAIAGVRAKTIVLCGSEDGLFAAERLAAKLGLRIAIRRFERKNPLRVVESIPLNKLQPGDAVVAFSRNAVVELQSQIGRAGRSTAAIYGSLSPAVRRNEAERFRSGLADVLVATDAIGLGLNLPIRRLIFAAVEKYDGNTTRFLTPPEIRQIAGRAGRYGLHEAGEVTTLDPRWVKLLRRNLEPQVTTATELPIWISPTDDHLRRLSAIIGTNRISRLLQYFQTRVLRAEHSDLRITNLSESIDIAVALEMSDAFQTLPLGVRSTYARAPVPNRGLSLTILARWAEQHARLGKVQGEELTKELGARDRLLFYEDRSRLATLYLWLSLRFPEVYIKTDDMMDMRERTDSDIQSALLQIGANPRTTKQKNHQKPKVMKLRKNPATFDKRRLRK